MTQRTRIGLFYSYGPHFIKTVRSLRETHPQADITAFVPEHFPVELLSGLNISSQPLLPDTGRGRAIKKVVTIIRAIRKEHLDIFVVLFNSPRLQLLSTISGAKERRCRLVDGRELPVRLTLLSGIYHTAVNTVVGHWRYARIWIHVRCTRVHARTKERRSNTTGPDNEPY